MALSDFATAIQQCFIDVRGTFPDPQDRIRQLVQLVSGITNNQPADEFFRRTALSEIAISVSMLVLTSSTQADDLLVELVPLFETEMALAADADPASFQALNSVRTKMIADLKARGSALPSLLDIVYPVPLPTSVIAQLLYQDGTRADEIMIRNQPLHPLFVSGTIEVLSS